MTENEMYNVNFFKPLSTHAKANKKLIITLASIWFIGVFGFQILLIVLNEPTPEKSYLTFEKVWPGFQQTMEPTIDDQRDLAKSFLFVLGKNIALQEDHKAKIKTAFSTLVYKMVPDSMNYLVKQGVSDESLKLTKEAIGLSEAGFDKIMVDLLPTSLLNSEQIVPVSVNEIEDIMKLYLVHNQNALTDFKFLGFPFHYWYTAQFLLIMFVLLCLIYAYVIDRTNVKHNFVEET